MRICRGNRSSRRKPSAVTFYPAEIPHELSLRSNPGRRGGKSATNGLSYGMAYIGYSPLYDDESTIFSNLHTDTLVADTVSALGMFPF
jgi:hypothetical protein